MRTLLPSGISTIRAAMPSKALSSMWVMPPGITKSGAAKTGAKAPKTEPRLSGPAQPEVSPARHTVLQPSITFTEHDDSVYQGSLNAVTGEGFDPCHDEQLSPLSAAERETVSAPGEEAPGLQLGWTGSDVVRGFVMSEILNRRKREAS